MRGGGREKEGDVRRRAERGKVILVFEEGAKREIECDVAEGSKKKEGGVRACENVIGKKHKERVDSLMCGERNVKRSIIIRYMYTYLWYLRSVVAKEGNIP